MVEQHNLFLSPKISAPWVKSKEKEAGFFLSLSLCNGLKGIERGNKAFYLSQSLFHSLSFSLSFSFTLSLSFVFFLFLSQLQENQSASTKPKRTKQGDHIQIIAPTEIANNFKNEFVENNTFTLENFEIEKNDGSIKVYVIGAFHELGHTQLVCGGNRKVQVNLKLKDLTGDILPCTLWDNFASKFVKFNNERKDTGPIIILMHNAKIKEATEKYELGVSNTWNYTKLFINEELPEILAFKKSLPADEPSSSQSLSLTPHSQLLTQTSSMSQSYTPNLMTKDAVVMPLNQILALTEVSGWYYKLCADCPRAAKGDTVPLFCDKNHPTYAINLRYKLDVEVESCGTKHTLVFWDRECNQLVGTSAAELHKQMDGVTNPLAYPMQLDNIGGRNLAVRIKWQRDWPKTCSVQAMKEDDAVIKDILNVIGAFHELGHTQLVCGGNRKVQVNLKLKDLTGDILPCTLWDNFASKFVKFNNERKDTGPIIILMHNAKIKEATEKYELGVSNTWNYTKLFINEELPEILAFKKSLPADEPSSSQSLSLTPHSQLLTQTSSMSQSYTPNLMTKDAVVMPLNQILALTEVSGWYYKLCADCPRAAKGDTVPLFCDKNHPTYAINLRYKLDVEVESCGTKHTLVFWDRECNQLVGTSAAELHKQMDGVTNPLAYPMQLDNIGGRNLAVRIKWQRDWPKTCSVQAMKEDDAVIKDILSQFPKDEETSKLCM
ncbi:hypothetical protein P8452_10451 [Trifolium repens]|nr:hypothetical protein P8452_10451 [Trifolium repens]